MDGLHLAAKSSITNHLMALCFIFFPLSNAQKEGKGKGGEAPAAPPREVEIPEELICKLCKELFKDAVVIPCCGDSFCDECKCGTIGCLLVTYTLSLTLLLHTLLLPHHFLSSSLSPILPSPIILPPPHLPSPSIILPHCPLHTPCIISCFLSSNQVFVLTCWRMGLCVESVSRAMCHLIHWCQTRS